MARNFGIERRGDKGRQFNPESADPPFGDWPDFDPPGAPKFPRVRSAFNIVGIFACVIGLVCAGYAFTFVMGW